MQCQGVTLVPIYSHPMEKFVFRDTYTHAGAEQECKTHKLTLAKEAQPTHNITECLNRFGQNVLRTTNVIYQYYWLGDCNSGRCKIFWNTGSKIYFYSMSKYGQSYKRGSTLALCEKGKTQLVPHILRHLRTDLTLLC